MMLLRAEERGGERHLGDLCCIDSYGSYVYLLIWIPFQFLGNPHRFRLIHGSTPTFDFMHIFDMFDS